MNFKFKQLLPLILLGAAVCPPAVFMISSSAWATLLTINIIITFGILINLLKKQSNKSIKKSLYLFLLLNSALMFVFSSENHVLLQIKAYQNQIVLIMMLILPAIIIWNSSLFVKNKDSNVSNLKLLLLGEKSIRNNTTMRFLTSTHKLIKGVLSSRNFTIYIINIAKFINSSFKISFNFQANTPTKNKKKPARTWFSIFTEYAFSFAGIIAATYTSYAATEKIMLATHFAHIKSCIIAIVVLTALCEIVNFMFRQLHSKTSHTKNSKAAHKLLQSIGASLFIVISIPKIFLWNESLKLLNSFIGIPSGIFQLLTVLFILVNIASIIISTLCTFYPEKNHSRANLHKAKSFKSKIFWAFFIPIILLNGVGIFATEFIQTYSLSNTSNRSFITFITILSLLYSVSVLTNWLQNYSWIKAKIDIISKSSGEIKKENVQSNTRKLQQGIGCGNLSKSGAW